MLIATIFIALATLVYAVAAVLALSQIKYLRAALELQGMTTVFEQWGSKDERLHRRFVFDSQDKGRELTAGNLSEEEEVIVEGVCASCNRIGLLVAIGLLREDYVREFIGESYRDLWQPLKPFVLQRQMSRGSYMKHFRLLAVRLGAEVEPIPHGGIP